MIVRVNEIRDGKPSRKMWFCNLVTCAPDLPLFPLSMPLLSGYASSSDEDDFKTESRIPTSSTDKTAPLSSLITYGGIATLISPAQTKRKRHPKKEKKLRQKRLKETNPESLDFLGPWAKDADSSDNEKYVEPEELSDDQAEPIPADHKERYTNATELFEDYEYMEPANELKKDIVEWFPPTKVKAVLKGHQSGVTSLQFFPQSGHLLLSAGNDGRIYLWDMSLYKLLRGFYGHNHAVKCVTFNSTGNTFLSCSYDKSVILWDTKTGTILKTLKVEAVPNTVIFNPNNENEILVGLANRHIEHFDLSQASFQQPIQVYDHHLGAINSLTAVDGNSRFMSTSDDRTVRFWRWQINIPDKIIADPTQHSMPCAVVHPKDNFIALQTMDNTILVIQGSGKFRFNKKKKFEGHKVAGYGIQIDCTLDGKIIMSGDAYGSAFFWSWNLGKLLKRIQVSNSYVSCIKSHPHHSTGVVVAGDNGDIVYYE